MAAAATSEPSHGPKDPKPQSVVVRVRPRARGRGGGGGGARGRAVKDSVSLLRARARATGAGAGAGAPASASVPPAARHATPLALPPSAQLMSSSYAWQWQSSRPAAAAAAAAAGSREIGRANPIAPLPLVLLLAFFQSGSGRSGTSQPPGHVLMMMMMPLWRHPETGLNTPTCTYPLFHLFIHDTLTHTQNDPILVR